MTWKNGRRSVYGAVLALASLFAAAPAAGASCAEPLSLAEALQRAEIAFVGTVKDVQYDGRLADFDVEEVWAGAVAARVVVSGGPSLSEFEGVAPGETIVTSIDRDFETGVRYLVVPFGVEEGVYMDNGCSVTQVYDPGLDEFRPASAGPPEVVGPDTQVMIARGALGVVTLLAVGTLVVTAMRRRPVEISG